jgi:flagellar motor protein MotB
MVAILGSLAGCVNQDKARLDGLESANRNLQGQHNAMKGALDACHQALGERDRLLAAARSEADALRQQLAQTPPPVEPAPAGWTAVPGGGVIAISDDVIFSPGRITLKEKSLRALDSVVGVLQSEYLEKDVFVVGHTDDQPIKKSGWDDNWQLSSERALAVSRYLRDHGVSPGRLVACGSSEYRPRAANSSAATRQQNRRVEIFAVDPQFHPTAVK